MDRVRRDQRIDVIRGLALVMIFINHVPGNAWERFTSRNFGFSDAAEIFVFLAGISAALAWGRFFDAGGDPRSGCWRIWRRARDLWLVHLMLTLAVGVLVFAFTRLLHTERLAGMDGWPLVMEDPMRALIGVPLMMHQFGYLNILPVYVALLAAAPGLIAAGIARPGWLLACSISLWMAAAMLKIWPPSWGGGYGWFLNPLSWQLIFVFGLLTGLSLRRGKSLISCNPPLMLLACGWLVTGLLVRQWPWFDQIFAGLVRDLRSLGLPYILVGFDKGYAQVPRLMHLLALVYVGSHMPVVRKWCGNDIAAPLRWMGRNSLSIFALGTVLSFVCRGLIEWGGAGLQHLLIPGGILTMALVARKMECRKEGRARRTGGYGTKQPALAWMGRS